MKKYYIYLGINKDGKYIYKTLSSLDENDGREYPQVSQTYSWGSPLWKRSKIIGNIFCVTMGEGDKFTYQPKDHPVDFWKNIQDRRKWDIASTAASLLIKQNKEAKDNNYKDLLSPIKDAYNNADYQLKPLIIAEVIRIITNR